MACPTTGQQRAMLLSVLLLAVSAGCATALTVGFYNQTCPTAEQLVRRAVTTAFNNNSGVAAGLIRMHFHDCFVRGCDGSVLIDSTANNVAEKDSPPNNPSLRGFEVIDAAKAAVEAQCPGTVSCADIVAFAARDSATLAGAIPFYQVPSGRRDGNVSIAAEALSNLPGPTLNASQLVDSFRSKNLTAEEMVILSGAHSIGRAHCPSFLNRLYNFSNSSTGIDPTISSAYASLLILLCPPNVTQNDSRTTSLDIITPNLLDNRYYVGVNLNLGLLTSDHALTTNATLAALVNDFAGNGTRWAARFAQAMIRMGAVQVKEGTVGEIRRNCRVINNSTASAGAGAGAAASGSFIETAASNGYDPIDRASF